MRIIMDHYLRRESDVDSDTDRRAACKRLLHATVFFTVAVVVCCLLYRPVRTIASLESGTNPHLSSESVAANAHQYRPINMLAGADLEDVPNLLENEKGWQELVRQWNACSADATLGCANAVEHARKAFIDKYPNDYFVAGSYRAYYPQTQALIIQVWHEALLPKGQKGAYTAGEPAVFDTELNRSGAVDLGCVPGNLMSASMNGLCQPESDSGAFIQVHATPELMDRIFTAFDVAQEEHVTRLFDDLCDDLSGSRNDDGSFCNEMAAFESDTQYKRSFYRRRSILFLSKGDPFHPVVRSMTAVVVGDPRHFAEFSETEHTRRSQM